MREAKVREKGEKERFGDVNLSVLRTEKEVMSQGRRMTLEGKKGKDRFSDEVSRRSTVLLIP